MRRSLVSLFLAALVAITAVSPAGASKPTPTPEPTATPSAEPEPTPTAEPEPTPSLEPEPTPEPTAEPTATTEPEPTPTAEPSPTADPSAEPDPEAVPPVDDPLDIEDRYIVVLASGADVPEVAQRHRERNGVRADRQFQRALRGFSAKLDARQRQALDADPNVLAIVPDERIELTAQSTPTGVSRVGARSSTIADIDGVDQRVDADVAIVDTGVGPHPDLNIAGGYNCASSDRSAWRDKEGHGTHVAGTVAALDNSYGVVGVAPGARIWGVRILDDNGEGLLSWYVCGLDWILAQRDPDDPSRPKIEAVNMSVAKWGRDDANCGFTNSDILHRAICRLWDGGITVVAAAANDSGSAALRVPASYNEVITVSALADSDGRAGGDGGSGCYSWGSYDSDDTFANFSNYGYDVDIIAPGKCINSTKINNSYGLSSGTSMAAPAVTGAVALYKATRPLATPKEVREALVYLGNYGWSTSTDPDDTADKLLDVSRLGKLGTFALASAPTATVSGGGSAVAVPVGITRSATFFETVRFIVDSQPSGWSTAWSPDRITGWTADTTNLVVSVPAGTLPGSYEIRIRATNQGRSDTSSVLVVVGAGARWHAVTPTRVLDTRIALGMSSRLIDGVPRVFRVTGTAVPSDATAVTGNLTITGPTGPGYVSIGATMTSNPSTSTINVRAGQTLANGVTVRIGPSGNLGILYDSTGGKSAHAVFDITGYYRSASSGSGGSTWEPVTATRLLDTRVGNGLAGPFTSRTVRTFQLAGRGSVPSYAVAVTGNLTVVGQTSPGYVSIGPSMTSSPSTSTINVVAGVTLANNVTLRIGSGGKVSAVYVGTGSARTDLLLDVTGYYVSGSGGASWFPINDNRIVDTRIDRGIDGRLADGVIETIDVAGPAVPDGAVAVVGNLTLVGPTGSGYSTVASSIIGAPGTSSINVRSGDTLANGVTFRLASNGSAKVVFEGASGTSTHAVIDIVGYFR